MEIVWGAGWNSSFGKWEKLMKDTWTIYKGVKGWGKIGNQDLYLFQLKVLRDFPLILSEENQC